MLLTPDTTIDALGGTGAVAVALDVEPNTVSSWRARGIPAHRWAALVRLAADKGLADITFEALAAAEPVEVRA